MPSLPGGLADLPGAQPEPGLYGVEQARLAYPRRTDQRADLALQRLTQLGDMLSRSGGSKDHRVSGAPVDRYLRGLGGPGEIMLVQHYDGGSLRRLGDEQETVEPGGVEIRLPERVHRHQLIQVGGDNIQIPATAGRAPHQLALAGQNLFDHAAPIGKLAQTDAVSDDDRRRRGALALVQALVGSGHDDPFADQHPVESRFSANHESLQLSRDRIPWQRRGAAICYARHAPPVESLAAVRFPRTAEVRCPRGRPAAG